jgi:uncharacterized protein YjlB
MKQGLRNPHVTLFNFDDNGRVPNSSMPVLKYKYAFSAGHITRQLLEKLVQGHDWYVDWVEKDAVYRYTHYHTVHEVLVIMNGDAEIQIGGTNGEKIKVTDGDILAIPAGVAHKRLSGGKNFSVAGLYMMGQTWDLLRQTPRNYREACLKLSEVMLPDTDPFYGENGPLTLHWK